MRFDIRIYLSLGNSRALMCVADLMEEYVEFNKGVVTESTTLGG